MTETPTEPRSRWRLPEHRLLRVLVLAWLTGLTAIGLVIIAIIIAGLIEGGFGS